MKAALSHAYAVAVEVEAETRRPVWTLKQTFNGYSASYGDDRQRSAGLRSSYGPYYQRGCSTCRTFQCSEQILSLWPKLPILWQRPFALHRVLASDGEGNEGHCSRG